MKFNKYFLFLLVLVCIVGCLVDSPKFADYSVRYDITGKVEIPEGGSAKNSEVWLVRVGAKVRAGDFKNGSAEGKEINLYSTSLNEDGTFAFLKIPDKTYNLFINLFSDDKKLLFGVFVPDVKITEDKSFNDLTLQPPGTFSVNIFYLHEGDEVSCTVENTPYKGSFNSDDQCVFTVPQGSYKIGVSSSAFKKELSVEILSNEKKIFGPLLGLADDEVVPDEPENLLLKYDNTKDTSINKGINFIIYEDV